MALHGALAAGATGGAPVDTPKAGFLAGVRDVRLWVSRLDDIESDLICEAILVAGDGLAAIYEFTLRDTLRSLLSGRATILLNTNGQLST
jgi:predicted hotdog family 3-hydroxylacyl-ACP dehydratase